MNDYSVALNQGISQPPRTEFLDYAKGILIFLVTLGHVIQGIIYDNSGFYQDPLFKTIYLFHMPLFMALAGYLAWGSLNRTPPEKFIFRRLINLVLPIFSWSVLASGILLAVHPAAGLPGVFRGFAGLFFGSLWFLWALFESSLLVALAKQCGRDNFFFALGSSILVCLLVPDFGKLYLFKYTFPFFWAGYLCAQHAGLVEKLARHTIFLTVAVVASIVGWFFWDEQTYVYVSKMTFSAGTADVILFRFAAGLAASIAALWIFYRLFALLPLRLASWLGHRSLYVFVLQSYLFGGLEQFTHGSPASHAGRSPEMLALTVGPVLALVLSLVFGFAGTVVEKCPVLALLFFGKQLRG